MVALAVVAVAAIAGLCFVIWALLEQIAEMREDFAYERAQLTRTSPPPRRDKPKAESSEPEIDYGQRLAAVGTVTPSRAPFVDPEDD